MRRFYSGFSKIFKISETASRKSLGLDSGLKSETLSRILSWSHYCELLKEDNLSARAFYEIEAVENGWSIRELRRQMDALLYERLSLSRNKRKVKVLARKGQIIEKPEDAIKDPYVLEFLGLKDEYSESDLEEALIRHLESFLLELGGDFTFVARQKRLRVGGEWYRVDLVFYHRTLRCLVLIDPKIGKFTHADAGQTHLCPSLFD